MRLQFHETTTGVFQCDNGNDYVSEGLYRIVDKRGRIGYADESGRTVIKPRFAFGFPFENGKAKVTDKGENERSAGFGRRIPLLEKRRNGITSNKKRGIEVKKNRTTIVLLERLEKCRKGNRFGFMDERDNTCVRIHRYFIVSKHGRSLKGFLKNIPAVR